MVWADTEVAKKAAEARNFIVLRVQENDPPFLYITRPRRGNTCVKTSATWTGSGFEMKPEKAPRVATVE